MPTKKRNKNSLTSALKINYYIEKNDSHGLTSRSVRSNGLSSLLMVFKRNSGLWWSLLVKNIFCVARVCLHPSSVQTGKLQKLQGKSDYNVTRESGQ